MMTEEKSFSVGDHLCREGELVEHLFIIVDGEVDIQLVLGSGELAPVDILVAGDLVMWSAVVRPYRARFSSVARTDVTALAIEAVTLRELMHKDHELGFGLMLGIATALAHRLAGARVQLAAR
ncbi:MAG: cyclic nucleotide-binding domain-containing protein [Acidobacteriota bacterium]|nr:cyclic nucleotide-binding domain-containing protein [Acidobacteriota bacterium]